MADLRISIPTVEVLKNTRTDELEKALKVVFDNSSEWAYGYILWWLETRLEVYDPNIRLEYLYGFCKQMMDKYPDKFFNDYEEEYVDDFPDIDDNIIPSELDPSLGTPEELTENKENYSYNIKKIDKEENYSDDDEY